MKQTMNIGFPQVGRKIAAWMIAIWIRPEQERDIRESNTE